MRLRFIPLLMAAATGAIWAQSPAKPQFDAASVKSSPAGPGVQSFKGGPGTSDPGRISWSKAPLRQILIRAFGVESDQIAGPDWIDTERYEILATMPAATSAGDFKIMLQALLAERLGLAVHHETRNLPVYVLAVAKGGSKLKSSSGPGGGDTTAAPGTHFSVGSDGCPVLPAGRGWDAHTDAQGIECDSYGGYTMPDLAHQVAGLIKLGQGVRTPPHVVDRTGLEGAFDFKLRFQLQLVGPAMAAKLATDSSGDDPLGDNMSSLTKGLEQLGLSIRKTTEPLDVVVIDKIERVPVAN